MTDDLHIHQQDGRANQQDGRAEVVDAGTPRADLKVLRTRVYRGPNHWSYGPSVHLTVDLGVLEHWPTDRLPGFADALLALLPELAEHECSRGHPGGFVERMHEGTWLGHVSEHVAHALQTRAGCDVRRGKTRGSGTDGVYE